MAKSKDKKKKEREKRVAQKKLANAAKRRELAKKSDDAGNKGPRGTQVMTAGVKQQQQQQAQVTSAKPTVTHRRTGG